MTTFVSLRIGLVTGAALALVTAVANAQQPPPPPPAPPSAAAPPQAAPAAPAAPAAQGGMMRPGGPMMGPGMGQDMGPGMGQGMGPGMGQGMGPGMGQGVGPGMGQGMGPGMGQGMGPGMGHGMGPGMGHGMGPGMMGPGCPMMAGPGGDFAAGRLAFVKAELAITAAQVSAFDGFAETMKKQFKSMNELHSEMMSGMAKAQSPVERLDARRKVLEKRAAMLKDVRDALEKLYGTLTDEQKLKADVLLPGMGGVRCMM